MFYKVYYSNGLEGIRIAGTEIVFHAGINCSIEDYKTLFKLVEKGENN